MLEYGDAKLVSNNNVIENVVNEVIGTGALVENEDNMNNIANETTTSLVPNEKENLEETSSKTVDKDKNIQEQTKETANTVNDEYYTKSRLERDTMFSQMLESYQKILENNQIAADQKGIAQTEVKRINDLKNAVMICENLIKTKGFDDVVIFVNDKSISVIIKKDKIEAQEIAQIQNIVVRELNANIDDVHISTK